MTTTCGYCNTTLEKFTGIIGNKKACLPCYHTESDKERKFYGVLIGAGEICKGIAHHQKIEVGDAVFEENGKRIATTFPLAKVRIRYYKHDRDIITLQEYLDLPKDKSEDIRDVTITEVI
jgi:hypothetical protein